MFDISLPTDRLAMAGDRPQVDVVVNHLVGMGLHSIHTCNLIQESGRTGMYGNVYLGALDWGYPCRILNLTNANVDLVACLCRWVITMSPVKSKKWTFGLSVVFLPSLSSLRHFVAC